jgi:hypothetical protein
MKPPKDCTHFEPHFVDALQITMANHHGLPLDTFSPTSHPETIIACPEGNPESEGATPESDTRDTVPDAKPDTDDDDWHSAGSSDDPSDEIEDDLKR